MRPPAASSGLTHSFVGGTCLWASLSVVAWQTGLPSTSGGRNRSIPASRSGLREALETMGVTSSKLLLTRCYGLSLSDHYWIKPADSGLTWHNVNFFENPFSERRGRDALFGAPAKNEGFDFSSPDWTCDGNLRSAGPFWMGNACP